MLNKRTEALRTQQEDHKQLVRGTRAAVNAIADALIAIDDHLNQIE